ncbi:MAG: hypothetical protein Q8Q21_00800 [bacterium]|nr:hypothetical protein [bacterium]
MEDKLSFIPKRKMSEVTYRSKGAGFFVVISFLIFILSAFLWGGVFLYGKFTESQIESKKETLRKDKESYESSLISEIIGFSGKVKAAEMLMGRHKAFSGALDFLQVDTLKNVTFKNFLYNVSDSGKHVINMTGTARDYTELAVQADVFERSGAVEEVLFSGLRLNESNQVNFEVTITLNPSLMLYGFGLPEDGVSSSASDEFNNDFADDNEEFDDEEEFDFDEEEF